MSAPQRNETMRIGGQKISGDAGSLEVFNPYNNEVVGTVPRASRGQVQQALQIAKEFKPKLTRYERQQILTKTAHLLVARRDEISDLITAEAGLSKKDSLYEVECAFDVFSLASQLCILDDGQIFSCDLTPRGQKRKIFTQREPLKGVKCYHPLQPSVEHGGPQDCAQHCHQQSNGMQTDRTDSPDCTATGRCTLRSRSAPSPAMFQVVTGRPEDIGDEIICNPLIDLVTFTGSVRVGKMIAEKAGYRRIVLELGGNSPLIVMEDADLDRAATLAFEGATKNSGQRCTAVKRILVIDSIANDFVKLVTEKAKKLKYGDPMNPQTDVGTVINEQSAILFQRRVEDAVATGAKLLYGNNRQGAVFPPTVVDHVPWDCELVKQETFGPVIPIIRIQDIDEAIQVANGTAFGLSSGVCTNRLDYITHFIAELNHGAVNIWEVPGYRIEMSPFGGVKDSGLGYKEGVIEAMKSYTNLKTFSMPWVM